MADLEILLAAQVGFVEERIQRGLPVAKTLENAVQLARQVEAPTKISTIRKKLRPNEEAQSVRQGRAVHHHNEASERLMPQAATPAASEICSLALTAASLEVRHGKCNSEVRRKASPRKTPQ